MKITLTDEQKNVIKTFMKFLVNPKEKYMIIAGAAGCGKTTMIKYMLESIDKEYKLIKTLLSENPDKNEFNILLTATTNKAVAVLKELSNADNVATVHSAIGLKLNSNYNTGKQYLVKTDRYGPISNTLIILDEASMLDDATFGFIDAALTPGSKMVIIGDVFQLAPIQQKVSMMEKLDCPVATLHKVMRHAGSILETATVFRDVVKTLEFQDIPLSNEVSHVDGPTFQEQVESAFLDPNYCNGYAKILAWSNKRVQEYNHHMRNVLGLSQQIGEGETVITNNPIFINNRSISVDSEVLVTETGYATEKFGVKGCMLELDYKIFAFMPYDYNQAKQLMKMIAKKANSQELKSNPGERSKLWKNYYDIKENWLDLRSPFASTVHKSQGSSYNKVFIDLSDIGRCNIPSDTARMLYVAISRAKDQVVLYGELPLKYREQIAA